MNTIETKPSTQFHSMTKVYLFVFALLALFTVATVGISTLHLTRPKAISAALLIAGFKVSLIAAFFMHLKYEKKWIHAILLIALVFVTILFFLIFPDIGIH